VGGIQLSATLIVKNEERVLGDCLRSIAGIADEVVVVDTGSTDRTRHIARNLGARLFDFPWTGDFSAARNHALERARGEWILYIDADETVRACDPARLRAQLSDPSRVAYRVLLHVRPTVTPYLEMRLFRNDPLIRFRGVMHETIWPGIAAYRARRGGQVGDSGLVLDHSGYEGDQTPKHWRNLPLLSRALRDDPSRVFVLCHLASACVGIGREALAERAWRIALEIVRAKRGRGLIVDDVLPYISLIERELAAGGDPEILLSEAERQFPRNLQLRWLRGRALQRAGRYGDALPLFEGLIGAGGADQTMGYDTRLFGELPLAAVAACQFKLGRYAEAARSFERAAASSPETLEYRVKRALCLDLAGARSGSGQPALPA
jgi:glycosyltransferase involved in cell wall biosynthesis